jgi:hypothetical protein
MHGRQSHSQRQFGWASAERLEGGREYPPNFEGGSFQV